MIEIDRFRDFARQCRELAERADAATAAILLDLAGDYERRAEALERDPPSEPAPEAEPAKPPLAPDEA